MLRLLRPATALIFRTLYVSVLSVFLVALQCQHEGEEGGIPGSLEAFPTVKRASPAAAQPAQPAQPHR